MGRDEWIPPYGRLAAPGVLPSGADAKGREPRQMLSRCLPVSGADASGRIDGLGWGGCRSGSVGGNLGLFVVPWTQRHWKCSKSQSVIQRGWVIRCVRFRHHASLVAFESQMP